MIGDLSIADPHRVDRFEVDGLTSRGDAEEVTKLGAVVGLVRRDDVAADCLPMNLGPEVGKRLAQTALQDANASFVGRGAGLRGVVDEVISEQFVE